MLLLQHTRHAVRRTLASGLSVARASISSKMGAIVKGSGPVDTNARIKALRDEMQKEDVQA